MESNSDRQLLITDQQNEIIEEQNTPNFKNSILLKTITFGASSLFFAAHLVLNGKYLALLSKDGSSASALMSTYQSVIFGSGVGFLLETGPDFVAAVGQMEYSSAGDIAKSETILSFFLSGLFSGTTLSTKIIFHLIFEKKPQKLQLIFLLDMLQLLSPHCF